MTSIPNWGVFTDAKGRRCVAYNCGCDYCLNVEADGTQVFVVKGDNERCMGIDERYPKVRSMAVPANRNPGTPDRLPVHTEVFFRGRMTFKSTNRRLTAWWCLMAQLQRITASGASGSPPASLHIERKPSNNMEYFRAWICRSDIPNGIALDTPRLIVPRDKPFDFDIAYRDAKGGPDGFLKIVVTVEGKAPFVVCDYVGPTGYDDTEGLYAGWGVYAANGWEPRQLPVVFSYQNLDWGVSPTAA